MSGLVTASSVEVLGEAGEAGARVLTPEALAFVAELQREFNPTRLELLAARGERQERLAGGGLPGFLEGTRGLREDPHWRVAPAPARPLDRRGAVTGARGREKVIKAL